MRKARKRRGNRCFARADDFTPVVRKPTAWRHDDLSLPCALLHHRRHKQVVADHELVYHARIAHARVVVFKIAQNRFAVFTGLFGKSGNLRSELPAERQDLREDRLMPGIEDTPRRGGNLHHGRERVYLRRTDEQLLLEGRARDERNPIAPAHHVGTYERLPEQPRAYHVRHDARKRTPFVHLVVEPHHDRHLLHAPCVADFAERIPERIGAVAVVEGAARRLGVECLAVAETVCAEVRAVELEPVHAIVANEAVQRLREPCVCIRMREVEEGGISVPPTARLRSVLETILPLARRRGIVFKEESALGRIPANVVRVLPPRDPAERRRVHADVRAHPQHHLEAHCVEFADHRLRVGEPRRVETPVAVSRLPCVVDHEDARLDAVRDHRLGVRQNVFLVLMVRQLDPRVELRGSEKARIGSAAGRREPAVHGMAVRAGKRLFAGCRHGHGGVGVHRDFAALDCDLGLLIRPDDVPMIGDEQRRALVGVVFAPEVYREVGPGRERHVRAEEVRRAPPAFARGDINGRDIGRNGHGHGAHGKRDGNTNGFHLKSPFGHGVKSHTTRKVVFTTRILPLSPVRRKRRRSMRKRQAWRCLPSR